MQFATIVEKLIQQIELLNEKSAESFNKSYLVNLETKISTAVLPVKEKLIARLHEANFHDRSVVQQNTKTNTSSLDSAGQPSVEIGLSSCTNAVNATETYYNGISSANVSSFSPASASTETASVLTKKLCGPRIGGMSVLQSSDDSSVPFTSAESTVVTSAPSLPSVLPLSLPAAIPSTDSLSKPARARKDKSAAKAASAGNNTGNTTGVPKSRSKSAGLNSVTPSPSTVAMTKRMSYDMMSEGYTTSSSSSTSRGKDTISESEGSSHGTDTDLMDECNDPAAVQHSTGLVHSASTESFHLGFTSTVTETAQVTQSVTPQEPTDKDTLLSQPFLVEPAHDDFFFSEFAGQSDFQVSQVNFDDYCDPTISGDYKAFLASGVGSKPPSGQSRQTQSRAEKRKTAGEKECESVKASHSASSSTMLIEPLVGYPEDCEFRMSSKRRRRLSQIVPNPRKPRTADYSCSVCTEPYQRVAEDNPWWAVYQHECPKCATVQIPRLDISLASNAIELDPNVVALYGEGIDDGEVEGFEGYALYEEDDESCDEDEEVEEEYMDDEEIKRDAFPFDTEGCLSSAHATRLLLLMSHARTCTGEHKSDQLSEVCQSTKFLMLHVRDCPGVDASGNTCRYSWCQPTKKMLRHLTRCFEPSTCGICTAASVSDSFAHLCKLNNSRASAVPIINEKLTYASRLESRDELALKLEAKRRQETLALMGSESVSGPSAMAVL